jgi:hypothetical protein
VADTTRHNAEINVNKTLNPGDPQSPRLEVSRVQIKRSSERRFKPVTFLLTLVRTTTLGKMAVEFPNHGGEGGGARCFPNFCRKPSALILSNVLKRATQVEKGANGKAVHL